MINARICDIYQLDRQLSEGGTGSFCLSHLTDTYYCCNNSAGVYRGVNWISNEAVVVKLALPEPSKSIIPYEAKIYEQLAGHRAVPFVRWVGRYSNGGYYKGETDVLVMDYLGPTLTQLRRVCRGTLTLKSVLMIGLQIVRFPPLL